VKLTPSIKSATLSLRNSRTVAEKNMVASESIGLLICLRNNEFIVFCDETALKEVGTRPEIGIPCPIGCEESALDLLLIVCGIPVGEDRSSISFSFDAVGEAPFKKIPGIKLDKVLAADRLGATLGYILGPSLGTKLGAKLGDDEGLLLGDLLGKTLGPSVGVTLGATLGFKLGKLLGPSVGVTLGATVGFELGDDEGKSEGTALGLGLGAGDSVGESVGRFETVGGDDFVLVGTPVTDGRVD
jgi:hypothetical protein